MKCTLNSNINNQFSIVYMSYVVSNYDYLQVGTFEKTYFFDNTGVDEQLIFKPNINTKFINTGNSQYVNFYPFVAGISSLDGDFSLNIDKPKFDSLNLQISMSISIREFHVRNVTIIFGYMIYDSSKITISLYEGQHLIPGNIAKDYIYGIRSIKTIQVPRLLQATPLSFDKQASPIIERQQLVPPFSQSSSIAAPLTAIDAVNIFPLVQTYPKTQRNQISRGPQFTPPTPSLTAQLLRKGQISKLKFKNIYLNPKVFAYVAQQDSVIDVKSSTLQYFRSFGLFSNKSFTNHKVVNKHSHKSENGVNTDLFNSLFGTNGFVILSASSDIDQTYYYQVNLAQPLIDASFSPTRSAPSVPPPSVPLSLLQAASQPIYYASTVTNKKPSLICSKGGILVGIEILVDYIQKQMVLKCVFCSPGTYVSPITKKCTPNPKVVSSAVISPRIGGPIRSKDAL